MSQFDPSSDVFAIHVDGRHAGIASRLPEGFLFHASSHRFDALDGRRFATIGEVRTAAGHLAALEGLSHRALKPWS